MIEIKVSHEIYMRALGQDGLDWSQGESSQPFLKQFCLFMWLTEEEA